MKKFSVILFFIALLVLGAISFTSCAPVNPNNPTYTTTWFEYTVTFADGTTEIFCATNVDGTAGGDTTLLKFYNESRLVAAYTNFDHFTSKENPLCKDKYANNY